MIDKLYSKLMDNSLAMNRMLNSTSYALCNNLGNNIDNFMRGVLHITDYSQYKYFMDLVVAIHRELDISLVNVQLDGFSYTMSLNSILRYAQGEDTHPYEYAKHHYYYPTGMLNNGDNTHLVTYGATQQFIPVSDNSYRVLYSAYEVLVNHYCHDLTWGVFLEALYETCSEYEYTVAGRFRNMKEAVAYGYQICTVY